jgi:predicted HicB family RNase H-like nuclease
MNFGGDVKMMTNDDNKIHFTLRLTKSVDQKVTDASSEMGVSKNAFILMILSERLKEEKTTLERE